MVEPENQSADNTEPTDLERLATELGQAAAEARTVISGREAGTDLVPSQRDAAAMKSDLARVKIEAERAAQILKSKADLLRAEADAMIRAANAELKPLQELVEQMKEGIWTVNLYLGRDEEIKTLREGSPAPADTQVTVRQLVLAMDQECALRAEEGGIDPVDIEEFDEWLLADPAHLEQVLPEPKGVVALVPRYEDKRYEDFWKAVYMNEANSKTYFLIRNGDHLYRTWTDFYTGAGSLKRLVPAADEFTEFFLDRGGLGREEPTPLEPGSEEWLKAEQRADARARHYMRVALILEGLVHRTTLFHPLPEWGISFLDHACHRDGRVRFLLDGDESRQLGAGTESFRDWQKRLNAQLRPGLRIIGHFGGYSDGFGGYKLEYRHGHERLHPPAAVYPPSNVPHLLERGSRGQLVFRYKREGELVYEDYYSSGREPKTRASCVVEPRDEWIIPFDLAEVEDMERFLLTRGDRPDYANMFPTLKAAIKAKHEEAAAEAPFGEMLAGILVRDVGGSAADAETAVEELIRWWKLKNRYHRPLIGTAKEQAKAIREIAAEYRTRLAAASSDDPELVASLASRPGFLHLARKASAGEPYVLYQREREDEDIYLKVTEVTKTRIEREPKRWQLWRPAMDTYRVLESSPDWKVWDRGARADENFSDPELASLINQVKKEVKRPLAITYGFHGGWRGRGRLLTVWYDDEKLSIPDRVLTGEWSPPLVERRDWRLTRSKAGSVELADGGDNFSGSSWAGSGSIFDRDRKPDERPWQVGYARENQLLWSDEAMAAELDEQQRRYEEARGQADESGVQELAYRASASIERAWEKRREALARAEFVAEYGDETLWEGHRKTIELPDFERPYQLLDVIESLLETGVDIDGLSVAEASALAADAPGREDRIEKRSARRRGKELSLDESLSDLLEFRFDLSFVDDDDFEEPEDNEAAVSEAEAEPEPPTADDVIEGEAEEVT